jgi:hypothetical protein
MLDELAPWLTPAKARDLINRLDHRSDPDQVIPAEYELSLAWGLSNHAKLIVEPLIGKKAPDLAVSGLFPEAEAIIEIAALSDDALSGDSAMARTANLISSYADSVRKGAGNNLHFQFLETSGYKQTRKRVGSFFQSQYFRQRLASHKFALTAVHKAQLKAWLAQWPPPEPLRIIGDETDVIVTWKERVFRGHNYFSSMPSEAHSLTDNPLYRRLKEKEKDQLKDAPPSYRRCIFLGDAGCRLLREPKDFDATKRRVSGESIILHFLEHSTIDLVAVFSPRCVRENTGHVESNPRLWHLFLYSKEPLPEAASAILKLVQADLPMPYLHGWQARSWVQQGMLSPQGRGQYRPATYSSCGNRMTAKISARGLMELLAGRLDAKQFKGWVAGDHFEHWLSQGYAITNVTFEPSGLDHDDDRVCIQLERDPSASPLQMPIKLSTAQKVVE